jgi:uncharacterized protein YyaL (SSP411 family)
MPNRLAQETSPYLLQHANNPVDWYPWGSEALERARAEDKPILLSIGYAACHWCHVMEHESFEDDATAALMNERFVNIKVDREERPDLDSIYMQAVQAMTGHGGWPMTMFLTPDGTPYYGGTYYPNEERHGMPSFRRVLTAVSDAYRTKKGDIARTASSIREMYANVGVKPSRATPLTAELFDRTAAALKAQYDPRHGGFGGAPKFPPTMVLESLLARWARKEDSDALDIARTTFIRMARGGIYDQIGGGFARYSVDAHWLVPHFEKMLYDNALLVRLGAHLWQATGDREIRRVTEETIEWVRREMTSPEGGFYSSLDADSEGHEGKFYVWSEGELRELLGTDAEPLLDYWGVSGEGNFEGANILNVRAEPAVVASTHGLALEALEARVGEARTKLYPIRGERVWPGRDEKILASWNGLMIRGLAEAARAFGGWGSANDSAGARSLAVRGGEFVFNELVRGSRVMRSTRAGQTKIPGFLEDHASVGLAALSLYELTFDTRWLDRARDLAESCVAHFWDDPTGSFFDTAHDHETLVTRPRDVADNAMTSGTSLAAELLVRIAEVTGNADARRRSTHVLETLAEPMARYPMAFGHMLTAADMVVHGAIELALVGQPGANDFDELAAAAGAVYAPSLIVAGGPPTDDESIPLLAHRPLVDGKATAYVCRGYTCDAPTTDGPALARQLSSAGRA